MLGYQKRCPMYIRRKLKLLSPWTKRLDLKDLVVYVYYTIELLYKILYARILRILDRAPRNTFYYLRTNAICTMPTTKPIMDGTIQPMPMEANGSMP